MSEQLNKTPEFSYEINLKDCWKDILITMLDGNGSLIFPGNTEQETESEAFLYDSICKFSNESGFYKDIDKRIKSYRNYVSLSNEETQSLTRKQTVIHLAFALYLLVEYKYLDKKRTKELSIGDAGNPYFSFQLNEKGIDVALKLVEHRDNERRHNVSASFSKKALIVSGFALVIASLSAWLNFQRLDLYEQNMERIDNKESVIFKSVDNKKTKASK